MKRINANGYERISKAAAFKLFCAGEALRVAPCKYRPDNQCILSDLTKDGMRSLGYDITSDDVLFDRFVNDYTYYNCNYEVGYYLAFYIKR